MSDTKILQKVPVGLSRKKITLYKNGDNPNIYYYFTWNGRVYRGSTGTDNLNLSVDKSYDIFHDVKTGRILNTPRKTVKFEDVVKKFLSHKEIDKVSERTLTEYKRQSKLLLEKFKGRDIESFGSKSVYLEYQEWRLKYYQTHTGVQKYKRNGQKTSLTGRSWSGVGNSTLNRECRLLVNILRFSKDYMDGLKGVEIKSYHDLPENRREEILSKKEYLDLQKYWKEKNPYYWMIISFVNNTGVRYPSELNEIKWKDVHFDKSYILIRKRKNKVKGEVLNTPIPMVGTTKKIIEELWDREGVKKGKEDYVFLNERGIQVKNITKSFKNSLIECGITKKLTMYSLRHLYTTRMVKRPELPLKMISFTLGHKDTTMVEKHYSHLRVEDVVSRFEISENHKQERKKQEKEDKSS